MTTFPDRMGSDGISGGEMTPGPWTLGEWDRNIFVYGGPNNDDIAEFNFADEHTVKITREEALANARLTAAAPDMLVLLKMLSGMDHHHTILAAIDATIARATGGQSPHLEKQEGGL